MSTFKQYIQAIVRGPLLAKTIHTSIREGSTSCDIDGKRSALWQQLCDELGTDEAHKKVMNWIQNPRPLSKD